MSDQFPCPHSARSSAPRYFDLGRDGRLIGEVLRCRGCGWCTVEIAGVGGTRVGSGLWLPAPADDGEYELTRLAGLAVRRRAWGLDRAAREAATVADLAAVKQLEGRRY
jgi:hypothetical protein